MESSMELPPPAPADAFSLDDDVPVPQNATPKQLQAPTAVGLSSNICTAVSPQQAQEQHAELRDSTMQDRRRQQQQPAAGAAKLASSAATADSAHLGQATSSSADPAAGLQTQQQQQTSPSKQRVTVSPPAEQHVDTAAVSTSSVMPAQSPAGDSQFESQPHKQQQIAKPQQQLQRQPLQHEQQQEGQHAGHSQQPRDLTGLLAQLSDNAEAIAAAEEVLGGLLARQSALHHTGRKMEQQQVLAVLQHGHLGFSKGRPVAAVLLYR